MEGSADAIEATMASRVEDRWARSGAFAGNFLPFAGAVDDDEAPLASAGGLQVKDTRTHKQKHTQNGVQHHTTCTSSAGENRAKIE